jgi:signal transduction histidine kinase
MPPVAPIHRVCDVTDHAGFSRRTHVGELIAVAAIVFVVVMGTAHIEPQGVERAVDAWAYVCGVGGALALLLWRRAPVVMLGIVAVEIFVYLSRAYPPGPALLPGPISLVLLGLRARRSIAWSGALVMLAAVTGGLLIGDGRGDRLALAAVGWTLAAVFAGQLIAARRDRIVAERERRNLAQHQALTDERLRIAQDLHDSVAHAMATINVQAGTAAHLLARRPEQIDAQQLGSALTAIRTASGEVLDELGAILGLLRGNADPTNADALQPQMGLERLDELVARARADGLSVTVTGGDLAAAVAVPVSAAAYRVVQEALSNVRRHAGAGARVTVLLEVANDGSVRLEVADAGGRLGAAVPAGRSAAEAARPKDGFGLIGMRERVAATGGQLEAGSAAGGGFRVIAEWPGR